MAVYDLFFLARLALLSFLWLYYLLTTQSQCTSWNFFKISYVRMYFVPNCKNAMEENHGVIQNTRNIVKEMLEKYGIIIAYIKQSVKREALLYRTLFP